jgi:PKD repeat protein
MCLNSELFFEYGNLGVEPYNHLWSDGSTASSLPLFVLGSNLYNVAVSDALGCVALDTVLIDLVNVEGPLASFEFGTICPFTENTFTDNSILASGDPITSYLWIFPNDSLTGASVFYTPNSLTPYPVELQILTAAGCEARKRDTIALLPKPQINFTFPTVVCPDLPYNYVANQQTPLEIVDWQWQFVSSLGATSNYSGFVASHSSDAAGNMSVSLIGTDINGCTDTTTHTVIVRPKPQVSFAFEEVCAGGIVVFQNNSTIAAPALIQNQQWNFGNGTSSGQFSPSKPYPTPGIYDVTLTVNGNNGCSSQSQQTVQVHAFPNVDYITDAACAGIEALFQDASTVVDGAVGDVFWSFNNANAVVGMEVNHTFSSAGVNQIEQTVRSVFGCESTRTTNLTMTALLNADFNIVPGALLADLPILFSNASVGQSAQYWVINGDTLTALSPQVTFGSAQIGDEVSVLLVVTNGVCSDSALQTYTVLENRTDLAVSQVFSTLNNGFYTVGAELENKGSTPITRADLFLRAPNAALIKETWNGWLPAGAKEIHVFAAQLSGQLSLEEQTQHYICTDARIVLPVGFPDEDMTNNEFCRSMNAENALSATPHPNPVVDFFTLRLVLPDSADVEITVYDSFGRVLEGVLESTNLPKGLNNIEVDARAWAQSVY